MDTTAAPNLEGVRRPRRRFSKEDRSRHLSAWAESGRSAEAYASQHGFSGQYLYRWRKLASRSGADQSESDGGSPFVAVQWNGSPPSSQPVSVTLRHGDLEFTVSAGQSSSDVIAILRAIKEEVLHV